MQRTRPAVAIIGAGLMGRWHAHAAARLGARVVAVVDTNDTRAAALAARHGARALRDLTELSNGAPRPDIAHVCTPAASHTPLALALLDGGMHVVCEKPLAANADEVSAMLAHARRAGRRVCAVHQFAFQHGVAVAKRRLGELGQLRRAVFTFSSAGGEGHPGSSLDNIVGEIVPHPLSVLAALWPEASLDGVAWSTCSSSPGEWLVTGAHGDALVSIAISLGARPTEASAAFAGTNATIRLDFFHGFALVHRGSASRVDKLARPFIHALTLLSAASANGVRRMLRWEPAYPGLRSLLRHFYAQVDGAASAQPQEDAALIALYRARDRLAEAMSPPSAS